MSDCYNGDNFKKLFLKMELPITYCLCGHPFDDEQSMIQCDVCRDWFHGACVNIREYMTLDIDKFHCPRCETTCGPSLMKTRSNWHRHDYMELNAETKPVQTGTPVFIRELKSRHFPKADDVVKYLRGQQLTIQYLQNNGFDAPIIIEGKEGLDMLVPPSNFSVYDVESYVGGDREMDVIDVARQNNIRMKLREFVEYYNAPVRTRILNVISLEFTNTGLSPLIEAPYIARKLDWANTVWPRDWPEDSELKRPEVQKYCLMGVKDSFTDFHIDFGGTSVWYHILRGEKIFYLIRPTPTNLQLYQHWMCSSTQSETFFGDQADACYKCVLKQGQTMLIPTGWIHAVLTPVDSLVFGGNFVHSLNIPMQIQIYEIEKKMKTPYKFQYPGFETISWFAAKKLLKELKELNNEGKKCPPYFLQGVKALLSILKQWNTDKDYNMVSRSQIPATINSQKMLKDISKEIRHAERFLISLNPPKPERESKRKKKKPLNKDFVDYEIADRMKNSPFTATLGETKKPDSVINETRTNCRPPIKMTLPKPLPAFPFVKKSISSTASADIAFSDKKRVSKPGKQSPKVIRFKLGDKEMVRSTNDNINVYGNFAIDSTVETPKELTWKQTSVYDFHDGSNESDFERFTIDEEPKRKKVTKAPQKKVKRLCTQDNNILSDTIPKNGIEELLKASVYTLGTTSQRLDVNPSASNTYFEPPAPTPIGSGRASPSTQDAIAGMLSISGQCYSSSSKKPVKTHKAAKPARDLIDDEDLLLENIDKVHQDDDFIYPALDVSDEDEFVFKSKGKREEDEAWNPKARVGPLLPKTNRPAREGAKKTSVEKGLEAAAAKRAKQPSTSKRTYNKRKKDLSIASPASSSVMSRESPVKASTTYTSILSSPNRLRDVKAKLAAPVPVERKPKKGMKTAKQRLGKILKIHKMIH